MNRPTPKTIRIFSIFIAALFILAQFAIITVSSTGAWCSPYLGAPTEKGHPVYQFNGYGFPLVFVTIVKEDCFQAQSTSYEWSPIGLGMDGLLLILISTPLWAGFLRKKPIDKI
jgi:hypothetical protein